MSTRSNIAIKNADGTVSAIYSHFDGYPEWNGRILLESWTDEAKVKELVETGNLSKLGSEIGEKHDFDKNDGVPESWCRFYGRDRGEEDALGSFYKDETEYWLSHDCGIEFKYLFKNNKWYISEGSSRPKILTTKRCEQKKERA